jgi:peptidoglycan/xylan/chitin deacetylase (PgdA/CDA1 family)
MDNPYYNWSPISARPPLRWPDGARVALCVIVSFEHMDWLPPAGSFVAPSSRRRRPYPAVPDIHETSYHDYGNRVGGFRVMRVLDRHGIRGTAAMDAGVATGCPTLVEECKKRGWEFIGHGLALSQMLTERMPETEEREHIARSLAAVREATGQTPAGWIGMDYGESSRTVRLLAEAGVRYVCDWPNDEQPYLMKVPRGQMVSLPVAVELDDVFTHTLRFIPIQRYATMITEAFDRLYADGATSGRLLVLSIHPTRIGQPFRVKYLERALGHIMGRQGVWAATGQEIVDWYLAHRPS